MKLKLFLIGVFLFVTLEMLTKPIYVKSFRGIIKASPTGAVIARVVRGTKLNQIGTQGFWVKIKYKGIHRFISKLFVAHKKPNMSHKPIRFNQLRNPNVIARRRASAEVTAASARGVKTFRPVNKLIKIDMTQVEIMENYHISNYDVEKFLMGIK